MLLYDILLQNKIYQTQNNIWNNFVNFNLDFKYIQNVKCCRDGNNVQERSFRNLNFDHIIHVLNVFLQKLFYFLCLNKKKQTFLRSNRFGNANPDDLMEHIATQATFDNTLNKTLNLVEILNSWTLQSGYPLVTINRTNLNQITVKQTWFLVNPLSTIQETPENATQKWYIPLTFTHKDELNFNLEKTPYWIRPTEASEGEITIN